MDSTYLAAVFALLAAGVWGSGDFTGGLAARRVGSFLSVFISYSVGLIFLLVLALATGESFPQRADMIWGAMAGVTGMLGLGALYRGFAEGRMGIVAPVSAVLGTAIPVIFASLFHGLPRELQLVGFVLALASIWMLSRPEPLSGRSAGLGLALVAGLCFGSFFTLLDQVSEATVFWPLIAGRLAACTLMAVVLLSRRRPIRLVKPTLGLLILAGLLDVSGNLFFLIAVQKGRLDVGAVLASLYPAVTALMARFIIKEHMTGIQTVGVGAAILAIVLITL